jgi:hypothetical protein
MDQNPELETWRYPAEGQWADFCYRLTEPDSEMARLDARFRETILVAVADLIRHYQEKAASILGVKLGTVVRLEQTQAGQTLSDPAEGEVQEPKPEAVEVAAGQSVTESNPATAEPSAAPAIDKTEAARRRGRRPDHERNDAIRNAISKHGENWRNYLNVRLRH